MLGWADTPQPSLCELNIVPTLHPQATSFFLGCLAHLRSIYGTLNLPKTLLTCLIKVTGNELSFSAYCFRMGGGISQKVSWLGSEELWSLWRPFFTALNPIWTWVGKGSSALTWLSWMLVFFLRCAKMKTKLFKLPCGLAICQNISFYSPAPQFWSHYVSSLTWNDPGVQHHISENMTAVFFSFRKMAFLLWTRLFSNPWGSSKTHRFW